MQGFAGTYEKIGGTHLCPEIEYTERELPGYVQIGTMHARKVVPIDNRLRVESLPDNVVRLSLILQGTIVDSMRYNLKDGDYTLYLNEQRRGDLTVYGIIACRDRTIRSNTNANNLYDLRTAGDIEVEAGIGDISGVESTTGDVCITQSSSKKGVSVTIKNVPARMPGEANRARPTPTPSFDFDGFFKERERIGFAESSALTQKLKADAAALKQRLETPAAAQSQRPIKVGVVGTIKKCTECGICNLSTRGGVSPPDMFTSEKGGTTATLGNRKETVVDGTYDIIQDEIRQLTIKRVGDFHNHSA